jgi:hypothetical protein
MPRASAGTPSTADRCGTRDRWKASSRKPRCCSLTVDFQALSATIPHPRWTETTPVRCSTARRKGFTLKLDEYNGLCAGAPVLGGLVWLILNLIWCPMRRFFDLRRQVKVQLSRFEDLKWRFSSIFNDNGTGEAAADQAAFSEAQTILDGLSNDLIAFGQSKRLATYLIRRLGIDPINAGRRLAVLADELGARNEDRDANYHAVARALKF